MNISRKFRHRVALSAILLSIALPVAADEVQDASALFKQKQYDQALAKLNAALVKSPKDMKARFLKAVIYAEQGRTNDAISVFQQLISDYPNVPEPYNNLGVLYTSLGQYKKAELQFEAAIRLKPNYAIAHENLGDLRLKMASTSYGYAVDADRGNTKAKGKRDEAAALSSGQPIAKPGASMAVPHTVPVAPPVAVTAPVQPAPVVAAAKPAPVPTAPVAKPVTAPAPVVATKPAPPTPAPVAVIPAKPAPAPVAVAKPAPAVPVAKVEPAKPAVAMTAPAKPSPAPVVAAPVKPAPVAVSKPAPVAPVAKVDPPKPAVVVPAKPVPAPAPVAVVAPVKPAPVPVAAAKPAPVAKVEPTKPAPVAAVAAKPVVATPPAKAVVTKSVDDRPAILDAVHAWAAAWSAKDGSKYLTYYAKEFNVPGGMTRAAWESQRIERINKPKFIKVGVGEVKVVKTDAEHATVTFQQAYESSTLNETAGKTLVMVKSGNGWLIREEKSAGGGAPVAAKISVEPTLTPADMRAPVYPSHPVLPPSATKSRGHDAAAPVFGESAHGLAAAPSHPVKAGGKSVAAKDDAVGAVYAWANAWSARDAERYLSFYAKEFNLPDGQSRADWEASRESRISKPKFIRISVDDVKLKQQDANHATVSFQQTYKSSSLNAVGPKTLVMVKSAAGWQIVDEKNR